MPKIETVKNQEVTSKTMKEVDLPYDPQPQCQQPQLQSRVIPKQKHFLLRNLQPRLWHKGLIYLLIGMQLTLLFISTNMINSLKSEINTYKSKPQKVKTAPVNVNADINKDWKTLQNIKNYKFVMDIPKTPIPKGV